MTTEKKIARVGRVESKVSTVHLRTTEYWGINLGDLRRVVAAADGMSDASEVSFESIQKHYVRNDEWMAKVVVVREETPNA